MNTTNLSYTYTVNASPEKVYNAINNVRGWWSQAIVGDTDKLGAEFKYAYKDMHRSTQKITELTPGKRVVWEVTDSYLSFIENKSEWNGTKVVFDIVPAGDKTELRFSHVGLTPQSQCYTMCYEGWGMYVNDSLKKLIETGTGNPDSGE